MIACLSPNLIFMQAVYSIKFTCTAAIYHIKCAMQLFLYIDTTDFQPFSTNQHTVTATDDIAIQLFCRNDDITLEYNDTVILRFIVNPGLAVLIQQLRTAGEYIRDNAIVDIVDNDRK